MKKLEALNDIVIAKHRRTNSELLSITPNTLQQTNTKRKVIMMLINIQAILL